MAHDVEAGLSKVVAPRLAARPLVDRIHRPSVTARRINSDRHKHPQFLPYSGVAASCTATMAADLAVRFLAGEVPVSSKVSWMGSAAEAKRASFEVTWRFRHFAESLRILPLYDRHCDLCGE